MIYLYVNFALKKKSFIYCFVLIFFRNPTQGIIINHPNGKDVYKGVLHDYTGKVTNSKYYFSL